MNNQALIENTIKEMDEIDDVTIEECSVDEE